jgi:hypothetical protein
MTKLYKKIIAEKIFYHKLRFTSPLSSGKNVQAKGDVFCPPNRHPVFQNMKFLRVIFALLDLNPHSQSGSGSSLPTLMRIRIHNTAIYRKFPFQNNQFFLFFRTTYNLTRDRLPLKPVAVKVNNMRNLWHSTEGDTGSQGSPSTEYGTVPK